MRKAHFISLSRPRIGSVCGPKRNQTPIICLGVKKGALRILDDKRSRVRRSVLNTDAMFVPSNQDGFISQFVNHLLHGLKSFQSNDFYEALVGVIINGEWDVTESHNSAVGCG